MKSFKESKLQLISILIILIIGAWQEGYYAQSSSPEFEWIKNLGGSGSDDVRDIVSDISGNIIITGSFENVMTLGTTNLVSSGGSDIYIAKFDLNGNAIWAKQAGSADYDVGNSVTVDGNGDILVTGIYSGTASFGTIILTARGGYDIFIAKYSSTGTLLWAERAGGQGYDIAEQITTDNLNNVYLTGVFDGTVFFDTITVIGGQTPNVFIAKYNSVGNVQWVRTGISNSFFSGSYGIATSSTNDIYITGSFESSINFSGTILSGQQGGDIFLAKYNSNGIVSWAIQASGLSFSDEGRDVYVDKEDNVYVTGSFGQSVNFGGIVLISTGQTDIFVAKYNSMGDPIWVTQDGLQIQFLNNHGAGIAVDKAGNVAVISEISQDLSGEVNDLYISRYNRNGEKIWGFTCGSLSSDYAGKITIDNVGDILAAGRFYESGTFGSLVLTSNGFHDGFIGKLPAPSLTYESNLLDFGTVAVNSVNNLDLIIDNPANSTLHIYNAAIIGLNASEFSLTPTPGTIAPLQSQTFSIGFSPLANGIRSAQLIFESDAPTSPDTIFLSGNVGTLSITLSTNQLNFGSVSAGNFSDLTLNVTNPGTQPAVVFLPVITGTNQTEFSFLNSASFPDTLAPQEVKTITVRFSPATIGTKSAQLQILSNASSSPDIVELSGTGGSALELTLSTNLLDFGTVDTDNFSERILSVTNSGTEDVIIVLPLIIEIIQNNFSVSDISSFPDTLIPGEVKNITVRFSPTSPGSKSGQMQLLSNAPSSPDIVDLLGTAVTGIIVQLPNPPVLGQNILLNISPPAGFIPTGGDIFYRTTGDLSYDRSSLTLQGTNYAGDIPPQFATIKGIQFYIVFFDGSNTVTYPTINAAEQPAVLAVRVPLFPFQGLIPNSVYRMISLPVAVSNPSVAAVLNDDFGQYDSTMWRLFRWQSSLNNYAEFPVMPDQFTPGKAFWLIHRTGKSFDIEDAESVQSQNNFIIPLLPNSWTQIGNPFAFDIDWSLITDTLNLPLYRWNPDSLDYELNPLVIQPWDGYFVRNDNNFPVNLSVPPIRSVGDNHIPKTLVQFNNGEFAVQIRTSLENSRLRDNQNYIGMINNTDNIYFLDLPEPPPITDDLRLSIISEERYFAQNTTPVNSEGAVWNLRLKSTQSNKNVYLEFNILNNLPDGFNIYLLDTEKQISIPINYNRAVIDFTSQEVKKFKIVIGIEQFAKNNSDNISLTPTEYLLSQNYPNPFNPSTNIVYNLKEKSLVTIEVFDMLGRKIRSLINDEQQNSGLHTVVWNGLNSNGEFVSSGIYIYRIKANDFINSKKMILLK